MRENLTSGLGKGGRKRHNRAGPLFHRENRMHGSMSAAGGNKASRLDRAAPAPPADPTATIPTVTTALLALQATP